MKKILCVGQTTLDTTYVVDGYPPENTKVKATALYAMGGGSTGNAAYLLAKYKQDVSLVSTIESGSRGAVLLQEYGKIGLDVSRCVIRDDYVTPANTILINAKNASRTIVGYKSRNIIPSDYSVQYENAPEILYSDGYDEEIVKKMLDEFPGITMVLDAGAYRKEFIDLAPYAHYFICSRDFVLGFCEVPDITESNYEEIFKKISTITKHTIIVTLGEEGCLYKDNEKVVNMPAYPVKAVDTTGAGDIFHGAFTYGVSNGFDLKKCLSFASACSAISVTRIGGQTSIPELHEVYDLMGNPVPNGNG